MSLTGVRRRLLVGAVAMLMTAGCGGPPANASASAGEATAIANGAAQGQASTPPPAALPAEVQNWVRAPRRVR